MLAPKQRSVVVLRHWEQMSTEETAAALGMSAGTVKSTLHRALARLRQELESRDLDARALERGELRRDGEQRSISVPQGSGGDRAAGAVRRPDDRAGRASLAASGTAMAGLAAVGLFTVRLLHRRHRRAGRGPGAPTRCAVAKATPVAGAASTRGAARPRPWTRWS